MHLKEAVFLHVALPLAGHLTTIPLGEIGGSNKAHGKNMHNCTAGLPAGVVRCDVMAKAVPWLGLCTKTFFAATPCDLPAAAP